MNKKTAILQSSTSVTGLRISNAQTAASPVPYQSGYNDTATNKI